MLRIGLVTRPGAESERIAALLAERDIRVARECAPDAIAETDVAAADIAVWLVHVGEDDWSEGVDTLLDEARAPVFYDDPETLRGHAYPAYWARSLAERLREMVGEGAAGVTSDEAPAPDLVAEALPEGLDFSLAGFADDSAFDVLPSEAPISPASAPALDASLTIPRAEDWRDDHPELAATEPVSPTREPEAMAAEPISPPLDEFDVDALFADIETPEPAALTTVTTMASSHDELESAPEPESASAMADSVAELTLPDLDFDFHELPVTGDSTASGSDLGLAATEDHVSERLAMAADERLAVDHEVLHLGESDPLVPLEDLDLALPEELLALDELVVTDGMGTDEFAAGLDDWDLDLDSVADGPALVVDNVPTEALRLRVVVLAASLGGPAAVKRFLQALPPGLPAVFVLAQHIDPGFLPVLAKALETASDYQVVMVEGTHTLRAGELILVPVASRLEFAADGLISTSPAHWTPPYAPCINDVMRDVAEVYGSDAMAIVFSGMGDDGAEGARALARRGAVVWAQDAESCANSSMPDSARATEVVSFTGSPEELAQHCAESLGHGPAAAAVNH